MLSITLADCFRRIPATHFLRAYAFRQHHTMEAFVDTKKPTSMHRPKHWSDEVEEAYRLQLAGYRDAVEYKAVKGEVSQGILFFVLNPLTTVVHCVTLLFSH